MGQSPQLSQLVAHLHSYRCLGTLEGDEHLVWSCKWRPIVWCQLVLDFCWIPLEHFVPLL